MNSGWTVPEYARDLPATVRGLPLLKVTPLSNARLDVSRTAQGVYRMSLASFNLSLLGGANTTISASLAGTKMNFTTGNTIAFGSLVPPQSFALRLV